MAKRTKKSENSQEQDNREFFLALDMLEKERGIKKEYMLEKISQALATAYKRDHEGAGDKIAVIADAASPLRLPGRSSFRASARPSAARCTTPSPKRPANS